jgi:membrane-associated phospholipid phosphatase
MPDDGPDETRAEDTFSPESATQSRRALRRLWRAEIVYGVGLVAFSLLALLAHFSSYFGWDLRVSQSIQAIKPPGLMAFMRAVSFIGNGWHPYALATLTIIALLVLRFRAEGAGLALSTAGSAVLNSLIKTLIARPRPSTDLVTVVSNLDSRSFPSGHVTFYVCYFGFLFFVAYALLPRDALVRRIALVVLALPILLVGLSRVYLGAHWPSDTIGGYLFSGLWLGFSLHMYRRWKREYLTLEI